MRRTLVYLLKIALVVGIVVLLFKGVDIRAMLGDIKSVRRDVLLLYWGAWSGILAMLAWRWRILAGAQGIAVRFFRMAEYFLIGLFFNNVIPGSMGGDVVKAYYLTSEAPRRKEAAVVTVIADRLTGFFTIFGIGFVGIWLNRTNDSLRPAIFLFLTFFAGICVALFLVCQKTILKKVPLAERGLKWLPFERNLRRLYDAFYAYRYRKRAVAKALIVSLLLQLSSIVILYSIALSLGITQVRIGHFFLLLPLCSTIFAIPILPGGWGTGEIAFVALFSLLGVPANKALTLDLALRALNISWGLLGGIMYARPRWRLPARAREGTSAESEATSWYNGVSFNLLPRNFNNFAHFIRKINYSPAEPEREWMCERKRANLWRAKK